MAALRPFQERQETGSYLKFNKSLDAALDFWIFTLNTDLGRPMPLNVDHLPLHVTISDGEGSGSVGVGWWRPRDTAHRPRITRIDVPEAWRSHWKSLHKNVDINEVEAVGPMLALATWPDIRQGLWIHFVDNESAKFSLIRGSSSATSLNRIVHVT